MSPAARADRTLCHCITWRHGISSPDARTEATRGPCFVGCRAIGGLPRATEGGTQGHGQGAGCPDPLPQAGGPAQQAERWRDAVETLADLLEDYQAWKDNLPASLQDGEIADRLDELLKLRDLVDQLAAAELPKGFGRD